MITDNFTAEQIEAAFTALPEHIREVLASTRTGDILRRIGQDARLHVDQIASLSDITTLTLCGLLPREKFIETTMADLGVTRDQASALAARVNTDIFESVRATVETRTSEPGVQAPLSDEYDVIPSRADVLGEIEHPTPTRSTVAYPTTQPTIVPITKPVDTIVSPEDALVRTPLVPGTRTPVQESTPAPVGIMERRLAEEVATPAEHTPAPKPSVDPYREAVQ